MRSDLINLAGDIGHFFLLKNERSYHECHKEIDSLHITGLDIIDGKAVITLSRPGLLIGRKGEQIEKLAKHLGMPIYVKETENRVLDYLYPYEPYEWDTW